MAILKYVLGNMRRSKSYSITIGILVFITGLILSVTISTMNNSAKAFDQAYRRMGGPHLLYLFSVLKYKDEHRQWFEQRDDVEGVRLRLAYYSQGAQLKKNNSSIRSNLEFQILSYDPEDKMRLIDSAYSPETKLSQGEIYLPYIFKKTGGVSEGDTVEYAFGIGKISFKVAGFVEELVVGGEVDGEKFLYISEADIKRLLEIGQGKIDQNVQMRVRLSTEDEAACYQISKDFMKDYGSDVIYVKMLSSVKHNVLMLPNIAMSVLFTFAVMLCTITVTIMRYAILAMIEKDFVNIGIIKALGFTPAMVQVSITIQYTLLAFMSGIFSIFAGVFVTPLLGQIIVKSAGLYFEGSLSFVQGFLTLFPLVSIILIFAFLTARHSKKISPVRAIANGAAPVYFTSRLNVRLEKLGWLPLNGRMAIKQVLTKYRKYLLLIGISAILAYALGFSFALVDTFQSEASLGMMGAEFSDIMLVTNTKSEAEMLVSQIKRDYNVEYVNYRSKKQLEVDGDKLPFDVRDDFAASGTLHTLEGNFPKHDNEVVITSLLAGRYHKKVGDYLAIKDESGAEHEFIITGIFQTIDEGGALVMIHISGMKLLYPEFEQNTVYIKLRSVNDIENTISQMKTRYTGYIEIVNQRKTMEDMLNIIKTVFVAISELFFTLTVIIISIITLLMIKITLYGETKELGIYKAIGFSSAGLRLQLALRFAFITAAGGSIGILLEALFGAKLFSCVLKYAGISNLYLSYNMINILLPIIIISLLALISSYVSSANTKRVSVYGLISE